MDLEKSLQALRWRNSAEPLERRVLSAARQARVEQKIWRWTWRALAASVVLAVALNASVRSGPEPSGAPKIDPPSGLAFEPAGMGEFRDRARLAFSPPITPRKLPEVLP
jgi:hypothetical protein